MRRKGKGEAVCGAVLGRGLVGEEGKALQKSLLALALGDTSSSGVRSSLSGSRQSVGQSEPIEFSERSSSVNELRARSYEG